MPDSDLVSVSAHKTNTRVHVARANRCMVLIGVAVKALSDHSNRAAERCLRAFAPKTDVAKVHCHLLIEAGASTSGASATNQHKELMQTPASVDVYLNTGVHTLRASWRPLMLSLLVCLTYALQACSWPSSPPAPSPTPNPHPQKTSQLKISVQDGSGVNNVEVNSIWTVGDIGCAPIHPVSGAAIVKQIEAKEKVEKVGSYYVATIVDDRFLPDKCNWLGGDYGVSFWHDNQVLSSTGAGPNDFDESGKLELTCTTPPDDPPLCFPRKRELFLRNHFHGVFNVTLELIK